MLDNCEHVLDEAAELMEMLEQSCPRVQILATSREGVGIDGERILAVPSLGSPGPDVSVAAIVDADAVRLFLERARGFGAELEITADNAESVAQVCRRLDGVPLAIELAAARLPAMNPRDLAARFGPAFSGVGGWAARKDRTASDVAGGYRLVVRLVEPSRAAVARTSDGVQRGMDARRGGGSLCGRSGRRGRGVRSDRAACRPFAGGRGGPRFPDPIPTPGNHPRVWRGPPRGTRRNRRVPIPSRRVLLRVRRTCVSQARRSGTDRHRSPVRYRAREHVRRHQLCHRRGRRRSCPQARLRCALPAPTDRCRTPAPGGGGRSADRRGRASALPELPSPRRIPRGAARRPTASGEAP